MARTFVLPDLGEGLVEAEIRAVLVHEGDLVKEDAALLEVETDKAQVEIPSPFAGRVEKIHVQPGQTVKVGQPLVSFGDAAEAATARPAAAPRQSASPAPTAPPKAVTAAAPATTSPPSAPALAKSDGGPVAATPSTRRLARELGVDLTGCRAPARAGASPTTTCARRRARRPPPPLRPRRPARRRRRPDRPSRSLPSGSSRRPCRSSSSGGRWSVSPCRISAAPSPSAWHCPRLSSPTSRTSTKPTSPISTSW